jgi:hypothetical protein
VDALLFRPSAVDGPPEWKICADDWIDFYQGRGWFLLARERAIAEQRAADIQAVRHSDENTWAPPPLERRRHRWRVRRRRFGSTGE